MTLQRTTRLLIAAVLIGGASLAVGGLLAGSVPASSASSAAPAMLTEWTWFGTGGPSDNSWDLDCNWTTSICSTGGPYPDDVNDNPTFPDNSGTAWAVDLTAETIGELRILEHVDFDGPAGTATLKCQGVTFGGGITVTWTADGVIKDDG